MIVGGIVFRVVTPNFPGDPALDAAGAPFIRTEYLASEHEPWEWVLDIDVAHFFPFHLDAENAAKAISPRCHAIVATPQDQESVPERLQPRPEPPQFLEHRRARRVGPRKRASTTIDPFRAAQCRRDPVEAD